LPKLRREDAVAGREDGLFAANLGRPDFEQGAAGHFRGPRGLPDHDWIV
jgi:hypothetical protein